jgi:hypothetical protein
VGKVWKKRKKNRWGVGVRVGSMTHLLEFGRYCIALAKPRKQALLASFCKNIVNHEKKN